MYVSSFSTSKLSLFTLTFLMCLLATPFFVSAQANNDCSFTRTLTLGDEGQDVRCLQEYLNSTSYQVAPVGVGSPGNETTTYGSLTETAWQKGNNVAGANGNFGPASQAKYEALTVGQDGSDTPIAISEEQSYLQGILADLQAQVATAQASQETETNPQPEPTPTVAGVSTDADSAAADDAKDILEAAMRMVLDAQEQIEDDADGEDKADLHEDLRDTLEDLFDAIFDYFDERYDDADATGNDALDDATDVFEDAGGESNEEEAEDLLEDVADLFDEAEDTDEDVGDAEDHLEDAEKLLEDANKEFEERNYRQAISDALDAEEALEDARDEIDLMSDRDIENLIYDLWDELDEAEREVKDEEDDGENVEESEDLLRDAERSLKKADLAIDVEDYRDAKDEAEEAEELIEEALD